MRSTSRASPAPVNYLAVIGDVVQSRRITGAARAKLQRQFDALLTAINRRFAAATAARFVITVGDEFQGLLRDGVVIPDLVRQLESALPDIELRLGFGRGVLDTDLREQAIGMDGPVWHNARQAIELAKAGRRLGGVFAGFGTNDELTLNGLARVLHELRSRLTPKQRSILEELLAEHSQKDVARRLGISPQAVSKQAGASGVDAHREGEAALRAILRRHSSGANSP